MRLTEINLNEKLLPNPQKSNWKPGTWELESDFRSWKIKELNLNCFIKRMPNMGNLCGYVGVNPKHKFYKLPLKIVQNKLNNEYSDLEFSIHCACFIKEIKEVNPALYWIGFNYIYPEGYPGRFWGKFIPEIYQDMNKIISETHRFAIKIHDINLK